MNMAANAKWKSPFEQSMPLSHGLDLRFKKATQSVSRTSKERTTRKNVETSTTVTCAERVFDRAGCCALWHPFFHTHTENPDAAASFCCWSRTIHTHSQTTEADGLVSRLVDPPATFCQSDRSGFSYPSRPAAAAAASATASIRIPSFGTCTRR